MLARSVALAAVACSLLNGCQSANSTADGRAVLAAPGAEMMRSRAPLAPDADPRQGNTEQYDAVASNPFQRTTQAPLSTFAADVDTASYANMRRLLREGQRPPAGSVRIEELINYFRYELPQPQGDAPFSMTSELGACPWKPEHRLLRIALQGRALPSSELPPRNLVFLLDVSGSMNNADKLPLLKSALKLLVEQLTARDRVAIVVYAGASGLALESTPGDQQLRILGALEGLQAGGSTNGGAGIHLAYHTARQHVVPGGINRVILATDGDFNVGTTNRSELVSLIERERASGVFLSVLGFGRGNLKDATMEELSNKGNGNYAYIDSLAEARKVLVEEAGGTLVTIAKDVKIQVEFNPAQVAAYRLIGYENRLLAAQDFNDDRKDAGELGAGHSVTALYEIVPAGAELPAGTTDPLKYQGERPPTPAAGGDELATVKVRYKAPAGETSQLLNAPVSAASKPLAETSRDFRWAAGVAAFGMLLRKCPHRGASDHALVERLAQGSLGTDPFRYRREFQELVAADKRLLSGE